MCGIFATTEADAWRPLTDRVTSMLPGRSVDGTVTIMFNGEIYNYADLAVRLGCAGETSDTRVLTRVACSAA